MGMEEKCFILIHCFRLRSCLSLELYLQRYWGKHTNSSETESKPSSYIYVILLYMEEFPTGKSHFQTVNLSASLQKCPSYPPLCLLLSPKKLILLKESEKIS